MSEELKPCPFCGGKARMHVAFASGGDHSVGVYVECLECRSCSGTKWGDGAEEKAADAWNRRAERTCHLIHEVEEEDDEFFDTVELHYYVCSECGLNNRPDAYYCDSCGARVI